MTVHYGKVDDKAAPCGYVFQKRLRGLDRSSNWDPRSPVPIDCLDCIVGHRPAKRKILPWHVDADKKR